MEGWHFASPGLSVLWGSGPEPWAWWPKSGRFRVPLDRDPAAEDPAVNPAEGRAAPAAQRVAGPWAPRGCGQEGRARWGGRAAWRSSPEAPFPSREARYEWVSKAQELPGPTDNAEAPGFFDPNLL